MAAPLSRVTQLKLDQTLSQWQQWQLPAPLPARPPQLVARLDGGYSNHSFLVETPDQNRYVVRIEGSHSAAAGNNRQAEWRAMQLASAAQLAPTPRYFNPELGSLVCDYLPHDPSQQHTPAQIGELLRRIHQLPGIHTRLDLRERLRRYLGHIEHRGRDLPQGLSSARQPVLNQLDLLAASAHAPVLCHNDLLLANRLCSGTRLYAIDWEFCGMGSPWFDLAVVSVGDELEPQAADQLLTTYLGGAEASPGQRDLLARYAVIYRYLELLWYCALDDDSIRAAQLSGQRMDRLLDALAALNP
jgi:thiamine kinase-like enzyme